MIVAPDAPMLLVMVCSVFVLAGFIKGVIGLGLPTVAIGVLSLFMSPVDAAALLMLPSTLTNLWQMFAGANLVPLLRRLWSMMVGIAAGTWAASGLVTSAGQGRATLLLGVALVIYAGLGLSAIRFSVSPSRERWLSPMMGVLTGATTAATATFVIPGTPYLQALELDRDDLVQAMGISFTVSTLSLAPALYAAGALNRGMLGASVLALSGALVGMVAGQFVRERISAEKFRTWFFVGLVMLGLHLVVQSLTKVLA